MSEWPEFVGQHGPAVWTTLVRLLGNPADAEDCFQETFLAAWKLSGQQLVGSWPGLLRQIATRRALEALRRRVRDANRSSTVDPDTEIDRKSDPPQQTAEARELAERLRLAIVELDSRQAEVFCLARLEEMSYDEIAARLELSVSHVGVLLNRARTALRRRLGDENRQAVEQTTGKAKP